MNYRDALRLCPPELLRSVVGDILCTVEQEKIGGETLSRLRAGTGGKDMERLVQTVLNAQQVVQGRAHEILRDQDLKWTKTLVHPEILPVVCVL